MTSQEKRERIAEIIKQFYIHSTGGLDGFGRKESIKLTYQILATLDTPTMSEDKPKFAVGEPIKLVGVVKEIESNKVTGEGWLYLIAIEGERQLIGLPARGVLIHERAIAKAL
jgi:hypothetical protein